MAPNLSSYLLDLLETDCIFPTLIKHILRFTGVISLYYRQKINENNIYPLTPVNCSKGLLFS